MRVLHVIPSLSVSDGGPSFAMQNMADGLASQGVEVTVVTTHSKATLNASSVSEAVKFQGNAKVLTFPRLTEFYKVSPKLARWLKQHVAEYDVIHVHALFSFSSTVAARAAKAAGVPYVIRPLGVLNQWGMENRRKGLKQWSFRFLERPLLDSAAAVHFTSGEEEREAQRLGLKCRPAIIPLGIDLQPFDALPPASVFFSRFPECAGRVNILFLSRIDPKKGLDLLFPAFQRIHQQHPQARLVVAGSGNSDYVSSCQELARRLGIQDAITWTGFLDGADRLAAFAAAEMFVMPSYSENFGIALLEAMASGLPCISTDAVALAADVARHDAVEVVRCDQNEIATAMSRLLGDKDRRTKLTQNARNTARQFYTLPAMSVAIKNLYQELVAERRAA